MLGAVGKLLEGLSLGGHDGNSCCSEDGGAESRGAGGELTGEGQA